MGGYVRLDNDTFTKDGAEALCRQIRKYWSERGYEVQADPIDCGFHKAVRHIRWAVKTDLVGGLPKNFKKESRAA